MREGWWLPVLAVSGLLGGCGGGSGGDTRPEVAPPPLTVPQSVHYPTENQKFTALTSSSSVTVNRASGAASSSSISAGTLTISYDASSESYTVTAPGHSTTFSSRDRDKTVRDNFTVYSKEGASSSQRLTLLKTFLVAGFNARFVAIGMWQRSTFLPSETDMQFDMFVYGFEAPVAAVPRTGTGNFGLDVFGVTTSPGFEPKALEGFGHFDVDFGAGAFLTSSLLREIDILTGAPKSGFHYELEGAGKLSSVDGTLSGPIIFTGGTRQMSGSLSGRFYGQDARDVGAIFSASDGNGGTIVGGMTGHSSIDMLSTNVTLAKLEHPAFLDSDSSLITDIEVLGEDVSGANLFLSGGRVHLLRDGTVNVTPGHGFASIGDVTPASIVLSDDPNFTVYEKTADVQKARISLYKTGSENTQFQLTYASFGQWHSTLENYVIENELRVFFAYGLRTPDWALSARTGNARYSGVAYGAGSNKATLTHYTVSGTSHFDVDFSRKSYSGDLRLFGTPVGGTGRVDFGSYNFGGELGSSSRFTAGLRQGGTEHGRLQAGFYGPNGEEIAGAFVLTVAPGNPGAGTAIAGATAAKQN